MDDEIFEKKKYNSLSGLEVIIGYRSGKVLFIGIKNKQCSMCDIARKNGREPKPHTCLKNHDLNKSSTSMESDAILEGFKESKKQNLVYETFIADRDSSVYNKIDTCKPYKSQNVHIEKVECTNHLLQNVGNTVIDVSNNGKCGKLKQAVASSSVRFQAATKKAIDYRLQEDSSLDQKIQNL